MTTFSGEIHPFAAVFPMLPDDELQALADSIEAEGQLHPILLDPKGVLLDGRNRLEACRRAGVDPRFESFSGDPYSLIIRANVRRRSLTAVQRAAAEAIRLGEAGKRVIGKNGQPRWAYGTKTESVDSRSSGDRAALADCGKVWDHDPAWLRDLILGKPLPPMLQRIADLEAMREAQAQVEAEERARIETLTAAGYMGRVSEGALTVDEAWTLFRKDTEKQREREAEELRAAHEEVEAISLAVFKLSQRENRIDQLIANLQTYRDQQRWPVADRLDAAAAVLAAMRTRREQLA